MANIIRGDHSKTVYQINIDPLKKETVVLTFEWKSIKSKSICLLQSTQNYRCAIKRSQKNFM